MTPINELSNKALLYVASAIGTAILAGSMSIIGAGLQKYANDRYVQRVDALDSWIDHYDRRAFELDEVFMIAGNELDPATARRLGADKAYYEQARAKLLRQRADLRQ